MKHNIKPQFVIKYGPPACGKGSDKVRSQINNIIPNYSSYKYKNLPSSKDSIVKKLSSPNSLNLFKKTKGKGDKNIANFNLNRLIEHDKDYIAKSRQLFQKLIKNRTVKQVSKELNTDSKFSKKGFNIYSNVYRKGENSNGSYLWNGSDKAIENAKKSKKHIVAEVSGRKKLNDKSMKWMSLTNKSKVYHHTFIFPLVSFEELWNRYKRRALLSYLSSGPFRFFSTKKQLKEQYDHAMKAFLSVLDNPKLRKTTFITIDNNNVLKFNVNKQVTKKMKKVKRLMKQKITAKIQNV